MVIFMKKQVIRTNKQLSSTIPSVHKIFQYLKIKKKLSSIT